MKKHYNFAAIIYFIFLLSGFQSLFAQNVAINATGAMPNASAMLDVASTTKGLLMPRMTTTERNAIASPATGLQVYNTSTNTNDTFNGTVWVSNATTPANGDLTPVGRLLIPMGEISLFNYSGVSTTITGASAGANGNDNMVKINPAGSVFVNDNFGTGTTNRLTYTGITTRMFHIALSFSFSPGATSDLYVFGVARNGIVQDSSKVVLKTGNTADNQSSAMHVLLELKNNEYVEFYVGKIGGSGSIVMKSFNFVAIGM